jgi:hypothetical protein
MGESAPPSRPPRRLAAAGPLDVAYARLLLQGLASVASSSPRGQADLVEALQAAGLPTSGAAEIGSALRLLVAKGCVENLQPLADGGLVLTVTGMGLSEGDATWGPFPPAAGTPTIRALPD